MEKMRTLLVLLLAAFASGQQSPIVTTKTGQVRGQLITLSQALQVYQFTAIPFAEPPTGSNRFKKPVPKLPWQGILDATKLPNTCPQNIIPASQLGFPNSSVVLGFTPKAPISEDCLFLNIWVPKVTLDNVNSNNNKKLAIYTFIHGGGFTGGATNVDMYNGTILSVFNNIIVVTVQYRLGSLGFSYLGTPNVPGNMGLWDQLEALKWVKDNIGAFGGNSSEVTIGGESAGAASVTCHLVSPYSRNYFKRAIVESGSVLAFWGQKSPEDAKDQTLEIFGGTARAVCSETQRATLDGILRCIQSTNISALLMADGLTQLAGGRFSPVIDGDFIPRDPGQMMQAGDFYKAPLMIGANKDEGSMFIAMSPEGRRLLPSQAGLRTERAMLDALNFTHYLEFLGAAYRMFAGPTINPLLFQAIEYQYWPTRHEGMPKGKEVIDAIVQGTGDYAITCPTFTWLQMASESGDMGSKIYPYYFTQRRSGSGFANWLGVMHGDELPFIFGEPFNPYSRNYGYSLDDRALSRTMMAYWTNFVKYGNPNTKDETTFNMSNGNTMRYLRTWPPYVGTDCSYQMMMLNAAAQTQRDIGSPGVLCGLKTRECLFWTLFFTPLSAVLPPSTSN